MQPAFWVTYLVNITRATGWARDYILWELPLAHGLQIQHAEAIFQGETMDWADGRGGKDMDDPAQSMLAQFRALRSRGD